MIQYRNYRTGKIPPDWDANEYPPHVWADINQPTLDDIAEIIARFPINIRGGDEPVEIEQSSRFFQVSGDTYILFDCISNKSLDFKTEVVTFLLGPDYLITRRHGDTVSVEQTIADVGRGLSLDWPIETFLLIIFREIDLQADIIELLSREIARINRCLSFDKKLDSDVIYHISDAQDKALMLRSLLFETKRILALIPRSFVLSTLQQDKLTTAAQDIGSLIENLSFSVQRLENLQNTFIALLNIEQNKTFKLLAFLSLIFMPPTLIAGIYGMNFDLMPELHWAWGYEFALLLMTVSVITTLWVLKKKKHI